MWICASTISMSLSPWCGSSRLLEVDSLGHRQPLEIAAQAVEPHLGGPEAHPLAPSENPTASGFGAVSGCDRQTDGTAEVDLVRPVVEVDQHRQRVARAGPPSCGVRDRLGDLARELARRRIAVETGPGVDLGEVARHDAAAEDFLRAGQVTEAR